MVPLKYFAFLTILLSGIACDLDATCAGDKPPAENRSSAVVRINEYLFQVGNVTIHKDEHFITIPGAINMRDGLLEYFACSRAGKLHESLLVLDAEPYHIQIGLLLLGLIPGSTPIAFQGSAELPCGAPLQIRIYWEVDNKIREFRPEELVLNINDKATMKKSDWVFTGSKIFNGRYMAQEDGSIIAIFHDPHAIIDHRSLSGADDTQFYANERVLPPLGAPVTVKIYKETDPSVKERVLCDSTDG